jgi:integrase
VEPWACWRRILKRAGLANLRIHDLRRSLGSWQAIGGASLPVIGKSLGHTQASTTQIYARLSMDPVRSSVEAATDAMLRIGKAGVVIDVKSNTVS